MKSSEKKIAANRTNGKKGTGPDNTLSTRYNAKKHGLLAAGVTELDDPEEYRRIVHGLDVSYADELKKFFRRRMALIMVRIRRAERYDAEFITSILNPRVYRSEDDLFKSVLSAPQLVDPGLPASIPHEFFDEVIKYQRYEVALENMLFRNMHGLERVERMAQGEQLPPPAAIDITVHKDPTELDSRAECLGEVVEGQLSEPANEGDAGEGTIDADTAPSDSFSGPEQVVDESFAQPRDQDADGEGNVAVHSDPAHWDSLSQCSEEQLPEDTDSEPCNEEEVDAER